MYSIFKSCLTRDPFINQKKLALINRYNQIVEYIELLCNLLTLD